jgi:hypothetical protein
MSEKTIICPFRARLIEKLNQKLSVSLNGHVPLVNVEDNRILGPLILEELHAYQYYLSFRPYPQGFHEV